MTCEDKIRSDNMIEFYFSIQHALSHVIDDHTTLNYWIVQSNTIWAWKFQVILLFNELTTTSTIL